MSTNLKKIYLEALTVNLNQGLLMDFNQQVYGAYNTDKKVFVLREGTLPKEVSLPDEVKDFAFIGVAGHLTVGYWNFTQYKETEI